MRINTNILSLSAQRSLAQTTKALARSMERLASGKRVNVARDDAAGLSMGSRLESSVRAIRQAVRNLNDAQGYLNTSEGALGAQTNIVQRMRELAIQAASGTYSASDRSYLDSEFQELMNEFERITNETLFGSQAILRESGRRMTIQVGATKSEQISFVLPTTQLAEIFEDTVEAATSTTVGDGTFQNPVSNPVNDRPDDITSADFNEDGHIDIVIGSGGGTVITIALGNGDGTFSNSTKTITSTPYAVAAKDINGDSHADIVASGNGAIGVLLGNGNGTFQALVTYARDASLDNDILIEDFDQDGDQDLLVSGYSMDHLNFYAGNGDGTFAARITFTSNGAFHMDVGDFNGDNIFDIAFADPNTTNAYVRLGIGDGTFQSQVTLNVGAGSVESVKIGDINNDGRDDVIAANLAGSGTVRAFLGNGNGTFQSLATISAGGGPQDLVLSDFNGDGNLDFGVANNNSDTVGYALGNGDGTFSSIVTMAADSVPFAIHAVDVNGDDIPDIIATNYNSDNFYTYFQNTGTAAGVSESILDPHSLSLLTSTEAEDTLEILDIALQNLSERRATIGAIQRRLESSEQVSLSTLESLSQARSHIEDLDYAEGMAEFIALQMKQQAATLVLAQANFNTRLLLELLQS